MRMHRSSTTGISRRDFSRLLALSGSVLLPEQLAAWPAPMAQTPERPDERFWTSVREQFLMPRDLAVMNAANLCPSPAPVLEAMYLSTKDMDGDPSFENRQKMSAGKEEARRPRGVPPCDGGGDRDHTQHKRGEQHGLERARPQSRR